MTNNRGITLIALIVTIVVLIIIASVTVKVGRDLIDKSKAENLITNMLIIRSKARVFEEEVEGKTWDFSNNIEEGQELSKKEQGRREHFENEYNFILIDNWNKLTYKMSSLESDSVYYALGKEALSKMGLASLWEEAASNYYIVKYTVKDNKYEDINVYYTEGVSYNKTMYYDLNLLQSVVND